MFVIPTDLTNLLIILYTNLFNTNPLNFSLAAGLCKIAQGSFIQEDAGCGEIAGIQSACIALFAISSLTIKEIDRYASWILILF